MAQTATELPRRLSWRVAYRAGGEGVLLHGQLRRLRGELRPHRVRCCESRTRGHGDVPLLALRCDVADPRRVRLERSPRTGGRVMTTAMEIEVEVDEAPPEIPVSVLKEAAAACEAPEPVVEGACLYTMEEDPDCVVAP